MYLAGKDAALYFARGKAFLEASKQDEEYFIMNMLDFASRDDKWEHVLISENIENVERNDSVFFQSFLEACSYNRGPMSVLSNYLCGGLYADYIAPIQYLDEESGEMREVFPKRDDDERELMTGRLITDFQETEFVEINMLPTNEDLDKIAKWICGGIKKSSFPYWAADNFLKELAYRENELVAIGYECGNQIISPYYVRLHNLEVKLKKQLLDSGIAFWKDWKFGIDPKKRRFPIWDIPEEQGKIVADGVYSNLNVENKDYFYREVRKKIRGCRGKELAIPIYVLVREHYLRKRPRTRLVQAEFGDDTEAENFNKGYRNFLPDANKEIYEWWKNFFASLVNGQDS